MLREWRCRRRLSQFELALEAHVSSRHVSFVETGRSSAEMLLHLAERRDVPLRERNDLLLAAGYAPAYAQQELDAPRDASHPRRDRGGG
jgi:transcriptional regulator with XRE-family HTH domain